MSLVIYNSLTQQKERFTPITPGQVKLYVCGMTVYDYCHIGHARSMITFDMVSRYLRQRGWAVTYVRNITDIDDKIIHRAQEQGEDSAALAARFIHAMSVDEAALGNQPPDQEPRATAHVPEIIALIQRLLDQGAAYVADNGDVYFDVRRFPTYGKLSNRAVDDLEAGARLAINVSKRDPLDFVLWKLAKPGEPTWPSPWGDGRPGWHIECSAMSVAALGQPFDIHGGGLDLKFPHHDNEIAQSEAAAVTPFAHVWMHAGLLNVDGEKMSKSLGNFLTIREVLAAHEPEVVRLFMLSSHYRSPVNYSQDNVLQARQTLMRLYTALRDLPWAAEAGTDAFVHDFNAAMDDDFNTPQALSVFFSLVHAINRWRDQGELQKAAGLAAGLRRLAGVFGVLQQDPAVFLHGDAPDTLSETVEALIEQRQAARAAKAWEKADQIRDALTEMGVVLEDRDGRTTWRRIP